MIISKSCNFGKKVATLQNDDRRRREDVSVVFDKAGDINDGVDPQHEVDQVIIDIDYCKEIDDFELDHLVDDITSIVDLELESDKVRFFGTPCSR